MVSAANLDNPKINAEDYRGDLGTDKEQ